MSATPKHGKIYFLRRADGLVKIGYTDNLKRRMSSLTRSHGTLEVLRVINGDRRRERQIHHQFVHLNEFGEWFRATDHLIVAIGALEEGPAVAVASSDRKRMWMAGETEMAEKAKEMCVQLIITRAARFGTTNQDAMSAIEDEHGIPFSTMDHLRRGKSITVSAFTFKRLKECLIEELTAHRNELLASAEAVERGEFPEALAARLAAAKGQAKIRREAA